MYNIKNEKGRSGVKKIIGEIFLKHSLSNWGVCEFEKTLPLIECRAKLRLPENPKSVIVTLFPYYVGEYSERNISRYAIIPDYHKVASAILKDISAQLKSHFPQNSFEPFVDSSPIREVAAAYNAGLGVVGENGLLINKEWGSFVFVAEIVTDLNITPDSPLPHSCLNCHKCENACIGGAIKGGRIDVSKCVSFITQKKAQLSDTEQALVKKGGLVWGCDVCSDVCPLNKNPKKTPIKAFYEKITPVYDGTFLKDSAYSFRGEKPLNRNLSLLKELEDGISK